MTELFEPFEASVLFQFFFAFQVRHDQIVKCQQLRDIVNEVMAASCNLSAWVVVKSQKTQLLQSKKGIELVPAHHLVAMQQEELEFGQFRQGFYFGQKVDVVFTQVRLPQFGQILDVRQVTGDYSVSFEVHCLQIDANYQ